MNKLFEEAIARPSSSARRLPEAEQDVAAEALLSIVHKDEPERTLTTEQIEDVKRIQRNIRAGRMQFATDEQLSVLWKNAAYEAALYNRCSRPHIRNSRLGRDPLA